MIIRQGTDRRDFSLFLNDFHNKYDEIGKLIEYKTATGVKQFNHFYEYDILGRLEHVFTSEDTLKPALCDISYEYNVDGTIDTVKISESSVNNYNIFVPYKYNISGRLEEIDHVDNPAIPFAAGYEYNMNGNIKSSQYYNAGIAANPRYKYEYDYDKLSRLLKADYYEYDSDWQNTNAFDVKDVHYDRQGNVLNLSRYKDDGLIIDDLVYNYKWGIPNAHDPTPTESGSGPHRSNRLLTIVESGAASAEDWDAEDLKFKYDGNGNIVKRTENNNSVIDTILYDENNLPVYILMEDGTEINYRYNNAGQRIYKKQGTNPAEFYIMDGSQILGLFSGTGRLRYWNIFGNDLAGRFEYKGIEGEVKKGEEYQVDDAIDENEEEVVDKSWEVDNQQVPDVYTFDIEGMHTVKVTTTKTDGSVEEEEFQVDVEEDNEFIKVKRFYLKDHLGSTRAVVTEQGELVESYDYYPFGLQMPGRIYMAGQAVTRNLFTNKELDSETNNYYFGARYYDPAIGRFLAIDRYADMYPDATPYHYVLNNPIRFVDANGDSVVPSPQPGIDYEETEPIEVVAGGYETSPYNPLGWASWLLFGNSNYYEVLLSPDKDKFMQHTSSFCGNLMPGGTAAVGISTKWSKRAIQVGTNIAKKQVTAAMLKFTRTTAQHMLEKGRQVPRHILADAINTGKQMADPQGAKGAVKIVSDMYRTGKKYSLEIIFRESDNTILHFTYK